MPRSTEGWCGELEAKADGAGFLWLICEKERREGSNSGMHPQADELLWGSLVQNKATSCCSSIPLSLVQGLLWHGLLCEACGHLQAACWLGGNVLSEGRSAACVALWQELGQLQFSFEKLRWDWHVQHFWFPVASQVAQQPGDGKVTLFLLDHSPNLVCFCGNNGSYGSPVSWHPEAVKKNMKEGESSSLELEKGGRMGQIVPEEVSKGYFRDGFHAGLISPHHPIFFRARNL